MERARERLEFEFEFCDGINADFFKWALRCKRPKRNDPFAF